MTTSTSLAQLTSTSSDAEFLARLKDLKNAVIGNVWKKVELAENEAVIRFLLDLLAIPSDSLTGTELEMKMEVVQETAVIIGVLANIGSLTLRPLLASDAPGRLLSLIQFLTSPHITLAEESRAKILPACIRALRNILVSTADLIWGHMWGVGAERKVIGTGLEEIVLRAQQHGQSSSTDAAGSSTAGKGKGVATRPTASSNTDTSPSGWRGNAEAALSLAFEEDNLNTLLSLLMSANTNPQILLPLYQLLSRLIALPSHREALIHWSPPYASSPPTTPYIFESLLQTISTCHSSLAGPSPMGRRPNPKILEAALDLLAALVRSSPAYASTVRGWSDPRGGGGSSSATTRGTGTPMTASFSSDVSMTPSEAPRLEDMLSAFTEKGTLGVQIAAASCLTNILKADEGNRHKHNLLLYKDALIAVISKILKGEALEERIKMCFVLALLASDDEDVQRSASSAACPARLTEMLRFVEEEEAKGDLGEDPSSRAKEAIFLALASLAGSYEPTRAYLAEIKPPFLPHLKSALSHPSYGVRAAACQLARALSRTVAILRTSLVDSGVGEEVIRVLKREHAARGRFSNPSSGSANAGAGDEDQGEQGERAYTVEVAATAAVCNLITDFSPLKTTLVNDGGLELLCDLTHSPYVPLALNAMWALKNLMFHETESLKNRVVTTLGLDNLKKFLSAATVPSLRGQALEIVQNLLADAHTSELSRTVEMLGEWDLLDLIAAAGHSDDLEVKVPALYVFSNLALGNERMRGALIARGDIREVLFLSLDSSSPQVVLPALRTFRHLVESNVKSRKPRQAMVDLLAPYRLKPRLKVLCDHTSLDVSHAAMALLEVLDRAKEPRSQAQAS